MGHHEITSWMHLGLFVVGYYFTSNILEIGLKFGS